MNLCYNSKGEIMKEIDIVCACIIQNQQVLIAKRASDVDNGIWEFPGGKVEINESCEAAITREIKEELNIKIHHLQHLVTTIDQTREYPLRVHAYLCEIKSGDIILNAHSKMQWIKPERIELDSFHRSDGQIIQSIIAYLAKK